MTRYYSFQRKTSHGSSLIEILVSLTLMAFLIVGTLRVINSSLLNSKESSKIRQESKVVSFLSAKFQEIVMDIDRHRLSISPRITHSFSYINQERIQTATHPLSESDIVFYLKVAATPPIEVTQKNISNNTLIGTLCSARKDISLGERSLDFIGIAPTGVFQVHGDILKLSPQCSTYLFSPNKGEVLPGPSYVELLSISKMIPIETTYSIFIDTLHQARWVSFLGDSIQENQPMIRDVGELIVESSINSNSLITIGLKFPSSLLKDSSVYFHSRLSREPFYNILYNDT